MSPFTQILINKVKAGNSVKAAVDLLLQVGILGAGVEAAIASYHELVSHVKALGEPSAMISLRVV